MFDHQLTKSLLAGYRVTVTAAVLASLATRSWPVPDDFRLSDGESWVLWDRSCHLLGTLETHYVLPAFIILEILQQPFVKLLRSKIFPAELACVKTDVVCCAPLFFAAAADNFASFLLPVVQGPRWPLRFRISGLAGVAGRNLSAL